MQVKLVVVCAALTVLALATSLHEAAILSQDAKTTIGYFACRRLETASLLLQAPNDGKHPTLYTFGSHHTVGDMTRSAMIARLPNGPHGACGLEQITQTGSEIIRAVVRPSASLVETLVAGRHQHQHHGHKEGHHQHHQQQQQQQQQQHQQQEKEEQGQEQQEVMTSFVLYCAQPEFSYRLQFAHGGHDHKSNRPTEDMLNDPELLARAKASHDALQSTPREYPLTAELLYGKSIDTGLAWIWAMLKYHFLPNHPFPTYEGTGETGLYFLNTGASLQRTGQRPGSSDTEVRIGLAADWASGTEESAYAASLMVADGFEPHYNIHIGDIYYVGSPDHVQANCLGVAPENVTNGVMWPHGSIGTFALTGNHEFYARGYGYFDYFLPAIGIINNSTGTSSGQKTSYFALENEYWKVIALDTGYNTYASGFSFDNSNNTQPLPIMDWLVNVVNISDPQDTRGVVFLSHHQYKSAFDKPYMATPTQIAQVFPPGKNAVWLWGHEHRLAFYNLSSTSDLPLQVYGRCLGVGGFPVDLANTPSDARSSGLYAYDDRLYETLSGIWSTPIGFNGFTRMYFHGPKLTLEYYSLAVDSVTGQLSPTNSTFLVSETFLADTNSGNVTLIDFNIVDPGITVVTSY